jgi:hypothetical protein
MSVGKNMSRPLAAFLLVLSVPLFVIGALIIDRLLPDYDRYASIFLGFTTGPNDSLYYMLLFGLVFLAVLTVLGRYGFTWITYIRDRNKIPTPKPDPIITAKPPVPGDERESFVPVSNAPDNLQPEDVIVRCGDDILDVIEVIQQPPLREKLDVMFILDDSSSMWIHKFGVLGSVSAFCRECINAGYKVKFGGCKFAVGRRFVSPLRPSSLPIFMTWLGGNFWRLTKWSEIDALDPLPTTYFRPDASKLFIIIGDDGNEELNPGRHNDSNEVTIASKMGVDCRWISVTTSGNKARPVVSALNGINIDLPRSGKLKVGGVGLTSILKATTIAKVRHWLPNRGAHTLDIAASDEGKFASSTYELKL